MDIAREKPKTNPIKKYWPWLLVAIVVIFAAQYLFKIGQADFVIDGERLVVSEVKQGDFSVSVRGNGVLVPADIEWLASQIDARVERVIVKPGKKVKKGDLIVQLSNSNLVQQMEEAQWELEALSAETNAEKVALETALLDQQALLLNAKLDYEASSLKQVAQAKLIKRGSGAVSQIDYEQTLLQTNQLKQRLAIQEKRFNKMQENHIAQASASKARLSKMKKVVNRLNQQVEELNVRATIDSVVQAMPLEPGQQITIGTNIAKLARHDSLIAELQIPELQISNVAQGQPVVIDTHNSKINGQVVRVDPAVVNGNVQVDIVLVGKLPPEARPDLSVDGEIKVAEIENALHVSRPLFAQSQSSSAVYKLVDNGEFAERVFVKLGKGSPNEIEVIEGLNVGDKIIVSDPTSWETYAKVKIN